MNILFRFNSKSESINIPDAKVIADKCNCVIENNFYSIEFDSPEDDNLRKLAKLVGHLKGSQITIDGSDPLNVKKLFLVSDCQNKFFCKGICSHYKLGFIPLDNFNERFNEYIQEGTLFIKNRLFIEKNAQFLKPISENEYIFDKEKLLTNIQSDLTLEKDFCSKFNLDSINKMVAEDIPGKVKLLDEEEFSERFEEKEVYSYKSIIRDILTTCELSSELSFEEIVKCSKIISFILASKSLNHIENTEIYLVSPPNLESLILIRIFFPDVQEGTDEEEDTPNLVKFILDTFSIKRMSFELYFQMFGEEKIIEAKTCFEFFKLIGANELIKVESKGRGN